MTSVALYNALLDAGIDKPKAERITEAVVARDEIRDFATKADLADTKAQLLYWIVGTTLAQLAVIGGQTALLVSLLR